MGSGVLPLVLVKKVPVVNRTAVLLPKPGVTGQVVAHRAARGRGAHQRDPLDAIAGKRAFAAFHQHARLGKDLVGLTHGDAERGVAVRVERLQQRDVRRAVDHFDEHVPPGQDGHPRPLEDQRPSAGVQGLGHHHAAERGWIGGTPDDDARGVRRALGGAGDEELLCHVREVFDPGGARHDVDRGLGYIAPGPPIAADTAGTGGTAAAATCATASTTANVRQYVRMATLTLPHV